MEFELPGWGLQRETENRTQLVMMHQQQVPKYNASAGHQTLGIEITQEDSNSKYLGSTAGEVASLAWRIRLGVIPR